MSSPSDNPAVVILDVFNLRGSYGEIKDQPFGIAEFDDYVSSVRRAIPSVTIIGILDGSAADTDRAHDFASEADQVELLQRSKLPMSDPQFVYLLPQQRADTRWDDQYLHADPVCIHLLRQFQPTSVLITHDGLNKSDDFKYLPMNDPLRGHIFRPWWAKSEGKWVFVSRSQVDSIWKVFRRKRIENREVQRVEEFFGSLTFANDDQGIVQERAFGYVHDFVNEYRAQKAAQRKGRLTFGDTSRSRSPFDVLNPGDFEEVSTASTEMVDDELVDVGGTNNSDVLVRVATEQIDLIRSIDELNVYVGRRVRLHAMLRFVGDVPYLVWFGLATRVRVSLEGPSYPLTSGLVRVEGMLSESDGELKISVSSARDIRQQSIVDVISGRITRLVQGDLFAGEGGDWGLPALPRRRASQVSPPPPPLSKPVSAGSSVGENRGQVPSEPSVRIVRESSNDVDTSDQVRVGHSESGAQTIAKTTSQAVGVELPKMPTIPRDNKRLRILLAVAVVATVAVAIAVTVALRTFVFAFELPEPAVCMNVEPAVCEEIVAEWRGDAIRINLYGTRGPDGLVS
jgi:hypothetical protein